MGIKKNPCSSLLFLHLISLIYAGRQNQKKLYKWLKCLHLSSEKIMWKWWILLLHPTRCACTHFHCKMSSWKKKGRKPICVLCSIHTSRNPVLKITHQVLKCKTKSSVSAAAVTEWDRRRLQVNIIFIRREGSYEAIACILLKVLGKG